MNKRPELELVDAPAPSKQELDAATAEVRALVGGELGRVDHEALLALVLGGDVVDESILDEERAEADALRLALEGEGEHPLAQLAQSLAVAAAPRDLDALTNERLVRRAFARSEETRSRRSPWPIVTGLVAVAAGLALFLGKAATTVDSAPNAAEARAHGAAAAAAAVAEARSTSELFDPSEPFAARGGESDRLGKIVASRATAFRAERFARWGVR